MEYKLSKNPDYLTLEREVKASFNSFRALDIEEHENSFSRTLVWLFNPREKHLQQHRFFQEFLRTFRQYVGLDKQSIEDIDPNDIWAFCESTNQKHRRFDVVIYFTAKKTNYILIFENKIWSTENQAKKNTKKQTEYYEEDLQNRFPDREFSKICFYLTPKGEKPESDLFIPITWDKISEICEIFLKSAVSIGDDVRFFVKQFMQAIERLTQGNKDTTLAIRALNQKFGINPKVRQMIAQKLNTCSDTMKFTPDHFLDPFIRLKGDLEQILGPEWSIQEQQDPRGIKYSIFKQEWCEGKAGNIVQFAFDYDKGKVYIEFEKALKYRGKRDNLFYDKLITMEEPQAFPLKRMKRGGEMVVNKQAWYAETLIQNYCPLTTPYENFKARVFLVFLKLIKAYTPIVDQILNTISEQRWNPHTHVLISDGCFYGEGEFKVDTK